MQNCWFYCNTGVMLYIEVTKYSALASLYIDMYEPQIYLHEDSGYPLA